MKYIKYPFLCLSIATLTACGTSSEKTAEQKATEATEAPIASTEEPVVTEATANTAPEDKTSYSKDLSSDTGIRFNVKTTGKGMMRDMTVVALQNGQEIANITEPIEGTIANTVTTDLNKNQKPELLVFVNGGGSGTYGTVYGYEFNGQEWAQLDLPPLTEAQRESYMGHDEFKVQGNQLLRTFPLYRDIDPNSNPSGGTRTITYTLNGTTLKAVSSKDAPK